MTAPRWPAHWQPEAIAAALPYVGGEDRLDILVGDPATARSGTRLSGHLDLRDDGVVIISHDRAGGPGVYPWPLLAGPVLVITRLRPRRRGVELFRHPGWPA